MRILECFEMLKLKIASHKTEAVMVLGRKKYIRYECINVTGNRMQLTGTVKYLEITLDLHLRYTEHITRVVKRSAESMYAQARLMPTVGQTQESNRRILASMTDSILMYGVLAWIRALQQQIYRLMI